MSDDGKSAPENWSPEDKKIVDLSFNLAVNHFAENNPNGQSFLIALSEDVEANPDVPRMKVAKGVFGKVLLEKRAREAEKNKTVKTAPAPQRD